MADSIVPRWLRAAFAALGIALLLASAVLTGLAASASLAAPTEPVLRMAFDDIGPRPGFDL